MRFGNDHAFWLLATLPLLVLFLVAAARARRQAVERFAAAPLAARLARSVNGRARTGKAVLLVAALLFGLLALAQPRWGFQWREVTRRGVDVFVLLDVSKSMLAEDVPPNRLQQARFAVKDLLHYLTGDRVGLIAFAGSAFVQCPLTIDREAFRLTLNAVDPSLIPRGGSAIARAVETALKAFEAGESRDRVMVLITDGEDTEGDPLAAASAAAEQGVRLYAIGVGTAEGELIPLRQDGQSMSFVKDDQGRVVKSRLNEAALREMAARTGGMYVRSAPGDFGMETIYREGIAHLQQDEYESRLQKRYYERYQWPLGLAVLLLVIEYFLPDRRRHGDQRLRRAAATAMSGSGIRAGIGVGLVLLGLMPLTAAAGPDRLYEQGKFDQALEQYRRAAEARPDHWALQHNLGAAAYRAGQYADAAQAFERALSTQDENLQARARYNLGNARYRLGEQAEQTPSIEDALALYRQSLHEYEQALELRADDEDAQVNRDIVTRKIEELEKQQQQQQQQEQEPEDQQQDDQQDPSEQPDDQPGEDDTADQQDPEQQESGPAQQPEPSEEQPSPDQDPSPADQPPPDYQRLQAERLLERLQETERVWNYYPELEREAARERGVVKDW